jgi:hypothetical protein
VAAKLVLDPKVDGLFYWLFINKAGDQKPHYGRFTILCTFRNSLYLG